MPAENRIPATSHYSGGCKWHCSAAGIIGHHKGDKTMKDDSIRKLTKNDCINLAEIMGFMPGTLKYYEGRHVKIIIKSPKTIKSKATGLTYRNER